jgi:stearoyl-CoA desaturase (delta-9 desaturase)
MQQKSWIQQPNWDAPASLGNISFLVLLPIVATGTAIWSVNHSGFHWGDLAIFFIMYALAGLSITAGYHRLLSHRAWAAHPVVRFFLLFFGTAAVENSALRWCSDHRIHHKFVDTDSDPYSIRKGFFYAHMGWIFLQEPKGRTLENVPDLLADPLVRWQHKYYLPLVFVSALAFPAFLGWLFFGRPLEGLIWGGLVRTVVSLHSTFLVNSAAHYFGSRNFSSSDSSRDNAMIALLTMGEGYHNFHHTFPTDYRNGYKWYHWDPTKWLVGSLRGLGLASDLRRIPAEKILLARVAVKTDAVPTALQQHAIALRQKVESAVATWTQLRAEYGRWKEFESSALPHAEKRLTAQKWKRELKASYRSVRMAWKEFRKHHRLLVAKAH